MKGKGGSEEEGGSEGEGVRGREGGSDRMERS